MSDDQLPETPELGEDQVKLLVQQGLLFQQLLQSDKFKMFLSAHFDMMQDKETKTLYLVETPPDVARTRINQMLAEAKERAEGGEEEPSRVLAPTPNEVALAKKGKL